MTDIKPDLIITDLPDPRPSDPIEALSWLGETEEEVVRGLRERGIKGRRYDSHACPLVTYLRIWFPEAWIGGSRTGETYAKSVATPGPYQTFRLRFDYGAYPDLIDNG